MLLALDIESLDYFVLRVRDQAILRADLLGGGCRIVPEVAERLSDIGGAFAGELPNGSRG
ncbi:hypothetical protein D3C86_1459540 [compost metagenome]